MKKVFAVFAACLLCLTLFAFSACEDKTKTNVDAQIYQVDVPWGLAAGHQERITLKDVEYTNTYYRATISGTMLYLKKDASFTRYEIAEQNVEFSQEYGDVWSTKISVEGLGEVTLYGNRLGDGFVSKSEIQCDNFTMTAMEYRTYREFSFLFYSDMQYLLFQESIMLTCAPAV